MRLCLLLLLLCCIRFLPAASAPSLDGRQFTIALVEDVSGKPQGKDTLVFAEGSGECQAAGKKYGYTKGLCTVVGARGTTATGTTNKGALMFHFTMTSAEHGDLRFEGVVKGKTIEGTRTWSKPGKPAIVHRFTGTHP